MEAVPPECWLSELRQSNCWIESTSRLQMALGKSDFANANVTHFRQV